MMGIFGSFWKKKEEIEKREISLMDVGVWFNKGFTLGNYR